MILYTILFSIIALILGFAIALLLNKNKIAEIQRRHAETEKQWTAENSSAITNQRLAEERLRLKTDETEKLQQETSQNAETIRHQAEIIATAQSDNKHLTEKLATQKAELEELQKRLTTEFENIANKVLKARSDEFIASNEKNLSAILNPLGERITEFKQQVAKAYDLEMRDKISLKEEVKRLTDLNVRVSEEANNLTKALKGDVKKQGNWGEIILERVLETSGLQKGIEYDREMVMEGLAGETQRPDVIIKLPDNKQIIVDSKVSLVAYERMTNAANEEEYNAALKAHIESLKKHVKELYDKQYQNAPELNTPDFVLMFVPIESSFSVAVQADQELFSYAWERKIVIVSPSTLLATLRTVASIWKQENQTKNALEIARLSGTLYDKLTGFIGDWSKVKENIDRAGKSYDDAMKKMSDGQGNVFRTANKIKELGAKATKELPQDLL